MPSFSRPARVLSTLILATALGCSSTKSPNQESTEHAQSTPTYTFPNESSPKTIGEKIAKNLLSRPDIQIHKNGVIYPEVCTAYGALRFAATTHDTALRDALIKRYEPMLSPDGNLPNGTKFVPTPNHVDYSVFGIVPLEIYRQTHDDRYLALGKRFADHQWENPTPEGLTPQTRFWIDDMFMVTALQVEAYRATNDKTYLDRAARELTAYLDKLQQPNGLFYHAPESKFYWGRGDGWVAVGMAELLSELPESHPQRARVLQGYTKMMDALVKHQSPSGMWLQLIDNPQSWPESSSTGMFTYALAEGVKHGWLKGPQYQQAVQKAWPALATNVDADGNVQNVCIGTNKGPTTQYYLDRKRATGDLHGQAATLWAAWSLLD